jgi:hypothetical protein
MHAATACLPACLLLRALLRLHHLRQSLLCPVPHLTTLTFCICASSSAAATNPRVSSSCCSAATACSQLPRRLLAPGPANRNLWRLSGTWRPLDLVKFSSICQRTHKVQGSIQQQPLPSWLVVPTVCLHVACQVLLSRPANLPHTRYYLPATHPTHPSHTTAPTCQ